MKIQCRHAEAYKAIRKTKCSCFVCQTKWEIAELKRENEKLRKAVKLSSELAAYSSMASAGSLYVANL